MQNSPKSTELKSQIREYIGKNLIIFDEKVDIKDEDDIFALGFVNSLFGMKLLGYLEAEYKIEISDDDLDLNNFRSVSMIEQFILKKQSKG